jgi:hypothetical protein
MEDAVTVLAGQHGHVAELIREIERQPAIGEQSMGGDLRRFQELIEELRRYFVVHETVKLRYLWPVLRREWPDGDAIAGAARAEKLHAEELFIKLRWLSERDVHVNAVTAELLTVIREHIRLESHFLGRLHDTFPGEALEGFGDRLNRRQVLAPTRPHPDMPSSPRLVAVLAPVTGLVDRVVEAFSFGPSGA